MHGVMAPELCELNLISLVILDWTKVQPRYGIDNCVMDDFDAHDFVTILLK
jgi:hypothetical protein